MNTDRIKDPEVRLLAGLATTLAPDYVRGDDDPWSGSPFRWILSVSSRQKGAIGEALIAGWSAAKGFHEELDAVRREVIILRRIIATTMLYLSSMDENSPLDEGDLLLDMSRQIKQYQTFRKDKP